MKKEEKRIEKRKESNAKSTLFFFCILIYLMYFSISADKYKTISEVQEALRREGLESSSLIIGKFLEESM